MDEREDHAAIGETGDAAEALSTPKRRADSDKLTPHETILLYGVMGGRCAKCKSLVVRESEASGRAFNLGKRAHIGGAARRVRAATPDRPARMSGVIRMH